MPVLIEAFASGEGVLYAADPLAIEGARSDPNDENAEGIWLLECTLELGAGWEPNA